MRIKQISFFIFLTILITGAACTSPTQNQSNANLSDTPNTNIANNTAASANSPETMTNSTPNPSSGISPSAIAAVHHQAMLKKDEAAFRKTLSQATLREFSADAQSEGAKTLVGYWIDYGSVPSKFESRNEQISGDTALLEIKNNDGSWTLNKLVRENGEWKLDLTRATTNALMNRSKGK